MKIDGDVRIAAGGGRKLRTSFVLVAALASFGAGSALTGWLMHAGRVRADSNRVFELMIYHTVPGKAPELENIFRDVSKMQAKYGLNVVGYWVPNEDPAWKDTFVYLIAHPSREQADKNWHAFHADPAFPASRSLAAPLIAKDGDEYKVDEVFMRPTDYSEMK